MPEHFFSKLRRLPNQLTPIFMVVLALLLTSCAQSPLNTHNQVSLYLPPAPATIATVNVPSFIVRDAEQQFNKIGAPSVRAGSNQELEIYVDPEKPVAYFEAQKFTTAKGLYTNLIYRIHFLEVPLGWTSINLTAGRNPGLLFIYTLDEAGTLLLVTTVHTCGCYLAFLPTEAMPRHFLPKDWTDEPQSVYGYTLPSTLKLPEKTTDSRIAFTLESETHRISGVTVTDSPTRQSIAHQVKMGLKPMLDLYHLPFQNKTVPFFETMGSRQGYVKDNTKILERLFLSWLALDFQVGEDKAYSIHDQSNAMFYTSLKFWARKASDLKNFPEFLSYWGWQM